MRNNTLQYQKTMSGHVAVAILRLFVTTDYGYSVRPTFEEQESPVLLHI
jgi:hypothetical protein